MGMRFDTFQGKVATSCSKNNFLCDYLTLERWRHWDISKRRGSIHVICQRTSLLLFHLLLRFSSEYWHHDDSVLAVHNIKFGALECSDTSASMPYTILWRVSSDICGKFACRTGRSCVLQRSYSIYQTPFVLFACKIRSFFFSVRLLMNLVANATVTTETRLWICLQCGNILLPYRQTNLTRQAIRVRIKHHHNTYGGDEVHFHTFLTSALLEFGGIHDPSALSPKKEHQL